MRFAGVRKLGLALPDVQEGTMYGAPALKVRGRMFACMASHKSAEPNTLVVIVGFDQRNALIAADPETFYLKDHYVNHPSVLVRLSRIPPHALRELLLKGWRFTASGDKSQAGRRPRNTVQRKRGIVFRRHERVAG
jgi:hypothetical protein